jgi:hypothetical protein
MAKMAIEILLTDEGMAETEEYFKNAVVTSTDKIGTKKATKKRTLDQKVMQAERRNQFDKLLTAAIEEALSTLGEPVKNAIYINLEDYFDIPKMQIPDKINDFCDLLHQIFGRLAADRLETKFIRNLKAKIEAKMPDIQSGYSTTDEVSFIEYVINMRGKFIVKHALGT